MQKNPLDAIFAPLVTDVRSGSCYLVTLWYDEQVYIIWLPDLCCLQVHYGVAIAGGQGHPGDEIEGAGNAGSPACL